jgi:leader peptidase (prepilin peptidase)/N-methyltransferase
VVLLAAIFSILFGLAFGSFLNVCISRLPEHNSVISPGSHCPSCGRRIYTRDNIPLLSWVLLGGRCRFCVWRVPVRYPLVELATALLFLLSYLAFGLTLKGGGMALLCFLLLGLAVMDAEGLLLPDAFTLPGIALGVLYSGITDGWHAVLWSFFYALLAALLVLLIRGAYWLVRHREGMGLGDAKLLAMIAAWLGPGQALLVLFLGVAGGAVFGLLLITIRYCKEHLSREPGHLKKNYIFLTNDTYSGTHPLPFGSFLCAAALFSIFWGPQILKWYLHFFR